MHLLQDNSTLSSKNLNGYNFKWLNKIKTILQCSGYQNLWEMQGQYDTKLPLSKNIYQSIKDIMLDVWQNKVQTGSRCTNYRIFKQTLGLEFYLTNLSPLFRLYMCRFRCVYNRLPVNKFKSRNETVIDKSCKLCDLSDVGDEYNFIFKCSYFEIERNLYLKRYYRINPSTNKMQQLFCSKNNVVLRKLAKFQGIILGKFSK